MSITVKSLSLVDFRGFTSQEFTFDAHNYIEGDNYKGKTSIMEAIAVLLLGTTLTGSPQVTDFIRDYGKKHGAKKFEITGVVVVDGEEHEIHRSRTSSKTTLMIDGNPATQADVDRFIGAKERFLSVFVPGYFTSLSNPVAREMLIGLTKRPKSEDVIKNLNEWGHILPGVVHKLRDPDGFAKELRADIKETEREISKIEGRIEVYQDILKRPVEPVLEFDSTELDELRQKLETEQSGGVALELERKRQRRSELLAKYNGFHFHDIPKAPYIHGDLCPTCNRALVGDALEHALGTFSVRVAELEDENLTTEAAKAEVYAEGKQIQKEIKELEAQLGETVDLSTIKDRIRELEGDEYTAKASRERSAMQQKEVDQAGENINREETEKARLDSEVFEKQETLKAVAAYRQELAKLQVKSITKHLDKVSIELFKMTQDGELKDDFSITYKGRDYHKLLSNSERIRADLEISSMFNKVLGSDFPIFIDNSESITHYDPPTCSQIFEARVVENAELSVYNDRGQVIK